MNTKICKQCGELKPIEQFRKYYGGRKGTYTTCKVCEKINAREKYLRRKDELSDAEAEELNKIHTLYELQMAAGLQPPNAAAGRSKPIADSLDDMLSKYQNANVLASVDAGATKEPTPAELLKWLAEPLTEEPDYYLDDVYETLKCQYRPVLRIGLDMQPVYDDTFKDVLDQVLSRFYEYEEKYWDKEDDDNE